MHLFVIFETLQQQSQAEFESVFVLPYLLIRGKSRVIHMKKIGMLGLSTTIYSLSVISY